MKKLMVTNLPAGTTEAKISEVFSRVGPVHSIIIPAHADAEPYYAFVEMENDGDAESAVARLDHVTIGECEVGVVPATVGCEHIQSEYCKSFLADQQF